LPAVIRHTYARRGTLWRANFKLDSTSDWSVEQAHGFETMQHGTLTVVVSNRLISASTVC